MLYSILKDYKIGDETRKKIEKALLISEEERLSTTKEKVQASKLVDDILADLFETSVTFNIPMQFINSDLGRKLFALKFESEYNYTPFEVSVLARQTITTIYGNRNDGKIYMFQRGGGWYAAELEIKRFLMSKGLSREQIEQRFEVFWDIKSKEKQKDIDHKEFVKRFNKAVSVLENKETAGRTYTAKQISIIAQMEIRLVYYNRDKGVLPMVQKGIHWRSDELGVREFLEAKGFSEEEIDKRIALFWSIKAESGKLSQAELNRKFVEAL